MKDTNYSIARVGKSATAFREQLMNGVDVHLVVYGVQCLVLLRPRLGGL